MGKGSKRQRKPARNPRKTKTRDDDAFPDEDMDDEIDAFHKQRDVVPLDVNATVGDLDDDAEQPVFDFEGGEDSDEDNTDEEDDDDINYDTPPKGLAAKIARQAKYLQQKFGGGDDEMHDDTEEEEEKRTVWGRKKNLYYSADNVDYEIQSSDEDLPMEEEAAVLEIQRERAKALSMEDFGLEDVEQDGSDTDGQEKTIGDIFVGPKAVTELNADANLENGAIESYEAIKKDLNALSKEEQMDVVYSSAPELVGLLSELNEAFNKAQKVRPLISEVSKREGIAKGKMQYFEVKHALLLTYCQAISFYLLLKSEGHPVRDHPVTVRLVEIKKLLEKMKQIDAISSEHEDIINHDSLNDSSNDPLGQNIQLECGPSMTNMSANLNDAFVNETTQLVKDSSSIDFHSKHAKQNKEDIQIGLQSTEMLKVRAALEAKLKQKGLYNLTSIKPEKTQNHVKKPLNGRLETLDDFDDEVHQTAIPHGMNSARLSKLSQLVANKTNHSKFVSGDEDLPKRDDIGERRRKHELRVLARAGADSVDEDKGDDNGCLGPKSMDVDTHGDILESEDEFYKEVKEKRTERLLEKAELYSRTSTVPSMLEEAADGKRQITYQMEKNRGLTRARKKLTKIPRKKYKLKHQKAVIRRKGQVRDIRKPTGPYGGEATGINTGISRSIRFKS